ncbi:YceD family protein [Candidatus Clostridium stratigraminis]|uniref:YceD family protein n=1 Tax=Candidatus Clostridium stratigraminis TaxID=3381661 RepID=A0ABW8T360_9CLOT
MKIDVIDLIAKKASKKKVHLVSSMENFYDDGEYIQFLKPVTLDGDVSISENVIRLEGKVTTELGLSCSRCLTSFNYNIDIQIHENFSNNPDNKDDEIIFIDSDIIDITENIKNNIILSLPIKKLCKDDCKGLCQVCGINLNVSSCNCTRDLVDPRLAKLKDLFSAN